MDAAIMYTQQLWIPVPDGAFQCSIMERSCAFKAIPYPRLCGCLNVAGGRSIIPIKGVASGSLAGKEGF